MGAMEEGREVERERGRQRDTEDRRGEEKEETSLLSPGVC